MTHLRDIAFRRLRKYVGRALLVFVGFCAFVSGVLLVVVHAEAARVLVARQLSASLSELFKGDLDIGAITELGSTITVENVVMRDAAGQPVVRVAKVRATVDLWALLKGQVVLERVTVERPWVSLHAHGESLALADAFALAEPGDSQPSGESTFVFAIRSGALQKGQVVAAPESLTVEGLDATLELSYSDAFRLGVSALGARVVRGESSAVELTLSGTSLRLCSGETSRIDATLRTGPDTLRVTGDASLDDTGSVSRARAGLTGHISPEGLRALGERAAADTLAVRVDLDVQVELHDGGKGLSLESTLRTPAGELRLEASRQGAIYKARTQSSRLALGQLTTLQGLGNASFDLTATATESAPGNFDVALDSGALHYGELALPSWQAKGKVEPDRVRLSSLAVPSWMGDDGRLRVDLELEYAGAVRGDVDIQMNHVVVHAADASAGQLTLRARAQGSLEHPVVDAQLTARGLRLSDYQLEHCDVSVKGGPREYVLRLSAAAGKVVASSRFAVRLFDGEQTVSGETQITGVTNAPLHLTLKELRARSDALEVHGLQVVSGETTLAVEGRHEFSGSSDLRAELTNLSLAEVAAHFPEKNQAALTGRGTAHVRFRGTPDAPDLSAAFELADVSVDGVAIGGLDVKAELGRQEKNLDLSVAFRGAYRDELYVRAQGALDARGPLLSRFENGSYVVSLRGHQDLSRLAPVWRLLAIDPSPTGLVALEGQFAGTLEHPEGELQVTVSELSQGEVVGLKGELGIELEAERTWLALRVEDARNTRVSAVVEMQKGVRELALRPDLLTLTTTPGSFELDLSVPRLDRVPALAALDLPIGLKGQVALTTSHEAPPRVKVDVQAKWEGPEGEGGAQGQAVVEPAPELRVSVNLQNSNLHVAFTGDLHGRTVLYGKLFGRAPLVDWVSTGQYEGGVGLDLDVADLDLSALPGNHLVSGALFGSILARDILGSAPSIDVKASVANLSVADGPLANLEVQGSARPEGGSLELSVVAEARDALRLTALLPWTWDGAAKLSPDLTRTHVSAHFSKLPLALLLGAIPGIAQVSGSLDGRVEASGNGETHDLTGRLKLEKGGFQVQDPLLRVESLDASLRFDPKSIVLESLRCLDQEGVLTAKGVMTLDKLVPTGGRIMLEATKLPVRRETVIVATVDGKVRAEVDLTGAPQQARVTLRDVAVRLPDQSAGHTQGLEPNPDVVFVDAAEEVVAEEAPRTRATPLEIEIDASQPFWLRHMDFAMQLAAKLRVVVDEQGTRLSGPVRIQRGFLNVLGKGFDLQRGEVVFDGAQEVDPTLTIDAIHKLSDGETVTVKVRGRMSAPELSFTSSVQGAGGDAEALQLLVTGRDSTAAETARAQVGVALAGLTAGMFSRFTRSKYGKYVPVLALEAGASSGTRLRAGVEANELIPSFLEDVVHGVYVEGYMGSKDEGGERQGAHGALMEFYFSQDIVAGGMWEVPNNWSVEVTWEP